LNPSAAKGVYGKLIGYKGCLSEKLRSELAEKNIDLINKSKKNMKKKFMKAYGSCLLRKRALMESVNGFLKNVCQIEHSRHRSPVNFMVNLMAGLAAYSCFPKSFR
jgi:hypothetical protein